MKKGVVVSDLHLFSKRSEGQSRFHGLSEKLATSDLLVLNGDIFDFRWAGCSHSESIPRALEWLELLRAEFPYLSIHFIPGNHDCLPVFVQAVAAMDGIELHEHHLLIGKNLFLHGDAATHRMDEVGFQKFRSTWENDSTRGKLAGTLYEAADYLRLSDLTHTLWFGGARAIRRLTWHLDHTVPGWEDKVDDCFFGHTHLPLSGVMEQGVRFHNTGSGNRGAPFAPVEFSFESNPTKNFQSNEK